MRPSFLFPLLLCAAAAAAAPVSAQESTFLLPQSDYADRFFENPHAVSDIGDPFVLPSQDGGYHVFATGGPIGFNVWQSTDLNTYEKSKALKKLSWAAGDYWAPEVFAVNGRYVMFYTARRSADNSLRIGIAFADAPQGPYEDPLGAPLFDFGYAAIDGTLVYDDAGTPYLIYSRDCSENVYEGRNESHLYGVRLADDLLSTVGEPVLLLRPDQSWEFASGDWRWNEGPAVLRHNGKYYLYYSANFYADSAYSVGVAVADSPLGPYVKQEQPLLSPVISGDKVIVSGPGHNSFFTRGDELFTAYHTHTYPLAPSGNRRLCIDRAGFHDDGTAYINGPTLGRQLRPLADLGLVNHARTAQIDRQHTALVDGDYCISPASSAYLWQGDHVRFAWDTPVSCDMIVLYPQAGSSLSGTLLLNGTPVCRFSHESSGNPGEMLPLCFAPVSVGELELRFDSPVFAGEILIIGLP